jgi:hypothetical protein
MANPTRVRKVEPDVPIGLFDSLLTKPRTKPVGDNGLHLPIQREGNLSLHDLVDTRERLGDSNRSPVL